MDFTNRGTQATTSPVATSQPSKRARDDNDGKWFRIAVVTGIALVMILIIGVILSIGSSNNSNNEAKYIDTGKLQAVFLNTGQVYFGNVKSLNNKYFVLSNIYYLQTSGGSNSSTGSSSSNNVSLVKLGCELHRPYDQMVISASQVTFWENLQSTGQVAKAVATFQQQNPTGQKCSEQTSSASTTSGSSAQNAATSSSPSSTPKTTTP